MCLCIDSRHDVVELLRDEVAALTRLRRGLRCERGEIGKLLERLHGTGCVSHHQVGNDNAKAGTLLESLRIVFSSAPALLTERPDRETGETDPITFAQPQAVRSWFWQSCDSQRPEP